MFARSLTFLRRFDWLLFVIVVLLVCFGLAAIYSVALSQENPDFSNFKKQVTFAAIGIVLIFSLSVLDYRIFQNHVWFLYAFSIALLLAVLFFGTTIRGTTGWLSFGAFRFQPVELVKLFLIIFLAHFFAKKGREMYKFKNLVASGFWTAIPVGLVLLQPDFGSALVIILLWLGMVLTVGVKKSHMFLIVILLIISFLFSWFFIFQDYQKDRVLTFLNPQSDPLGRGYNIAQSTIAIGSGQLLGRGLGFGSQSQLKFIPESQTDFIFAVIAEELGFVIVFLILVFFGVIYLRFILGAKKASDDFGLFLILGTSVLLFIQIFINMGMNMSIAPVTGISLPLLSYGGSFLLVTLMLIGIVESVICRGKRA